MAALTPANFGSRTGVAASPPGDTLPPGLAERLQDCAEAISRLIGEGGHIDVTAPWAGDRRTLGIRASDGEPAGAVADRVMRDLADEVDSITLLSTTGIGAELHRELAQRGRPMPVYEVGTTLIADRKWEVRGGGSWQIHGPLTAHHHWAVAYELVRARQAGFSYAAHQPGPYDAPGVPLNDRAGTLALLDSGLSVAGTNVLDLTAIASAFGLAEHPETLWTALTQLLHGELGQVDTVIDHYRDPATGTWHGAGIPFAIRRLFTATGPHVLEGDRAVRAVDFGSVGRLLSGAAAESPGPVAVLEVRAAELAELAVDRAARGLPWPAADFAGDPTDLQREIISQLLLLGVAAGDARAWADQIVNGVRDEQPRAQITVAEDQIAAAEADTATATVALGGGVLHVMREVLVGQPAVLDAAYEVAAHYLHDKTGETVSPADAAEIAYTSWPVAGLIEVLVLGQQTLAGLMGAEAGTTIRTRQSMADMIAVAGPAIHHFLTTHTHVVRDAFGGTLPPSGEAPVWEAQVSVAGRTTSLAEVLTELFAAEPTGAGRSIAGPGPAPARTATSGIWNLPQVTLDLPGEPRTDPATAGAHAALLAALHIAQPELAVARAAPASRPAALQSLRDALDTVLEAHPGLHLQARAAIKSVYRQDVVPWLAPALAALPPASEGTAGSAQSAGEILSMARVVRHPRTDWTAPLLAEAVGGQWRDISAGGLWDLPAGAVTLIWAQRDTEPEHLVIAQRTANGLILVETQSPAGARLETVTDVAGAERLLGGPARIVVDRDDRIIELTSGGAAAGTVPRPSATTDLGGMAAPRFGTAPVAPAGRPGTRLLEVGELTVLIVDDPDITPERLADLLAEAGPAPDEVRVLRPLPSLFGTTPASTWTGHHLISTTGWQIGLSGEQRTDHRGALSAAELTAAPVGPVLSEADAELVTQVNIELGAGQPFPTDRILQAVGEYRARGHHAGPVVTARTVSRYLLDNGRWGRLPGGAPPDAAATTERRADGLLAQLRATTLAAPHAHELLGTDFFGLRAPAHRPRFVPLIGNPGYSASHEPTRRLGPLLDQLNLTGPRPSAAPEARIWSAEVAEPEWWGPDAEQDFVAGGWAQRLDDAIEMPLLRHAIWLGGPLVDADARAVLVASARVLGGDWRTVLWTDVPRRDIQAVQQARAQGQNPYPELRDMIEWADREHVLLINVDEIFNADEPMALNDFYRSEKSKLEVRGYTAASDILRIEVMYRFGGLYADLDDTIVSLAGLRETFEQRGFAIMVLRNQDPVSVINSSFLSSRHSPFMNAHRHVTHRSYTVRQDALIPARVQEYDPQLFAYPAIHARRSSLMYRTGPGALDRLLTLVGLGHPDDMPGISPEAIQVGAAHSWVGREPFTRTPGQLPSDPVVVLQHVITTLVRHLVQREGDLYLTAVAPAMASLPDEAAGWSAVVRYLAGVPGLRQSIRTVTLDLVHPRTEGLGGFSSLPLPLSVHAALGVTSESEPTVIRAGEYRYPVHLSYALSSPSDAEDDELINEVNRRLAAHRRRTATVTATPTADEIVRARDQLRQWRPGTNPTAVQTMVFEYFRDNRHWGRLPGGAPPAPTSGSAAEVHTEPPTAIVAAVNLYELLDEEPRWVPESAREGLRLRREAAGAFGREIELWYAEVASKMPVTSENVDVFHRAGLEAFPVVRGIAALAALQAVASAEGNLQGLPLRSRLPLAEVVEQLGEYAVASLQEPAAGTAGGARLFLQSHDQAFREKLAVHVSSIVGRPVTADSLVPGSSFAGGSTAGADQGTWELPAVELELLHPASGLVTPEEADHLLATSIDLTERYGAESDSAQWWFRQARLTVARSAPPEPGRRPQLREIISYLPMERPFSVTVIDPARAEPNEVFTHLSNVSKKYQGGIRGLLVLDRADGEVERVYHQLALDFGLRLVLPLLDGAGEVVADRLDAFSLDSPTGWKMIRGTSGADVHEIIVPLERKVILDERQFVSLMETGTISAPGSSAAPAVEGTVVVPPVQAAPQADELGPREELTSLDPLPAVERDVPPAGLRSRPTAPPAGPRSTTGGVGERALPAHLRDAPLGVPAGPRSTTGGVGERALPAHLRDARPGPPAGPRPAPVKAVVRSHQALSRLLDKAADSVGANPVSDPGSCVVLLGEALKRLHPGRFASVAAAAGTVDDLAVDGRQTSGLIGGARLVPVRSWDEVEQRLVDAGPSSTALVLVQRSSAVGHALGAYRFPDGRIAWFDLQRGSGARVLDGQPTLSAARASVVVVDAAGREVPGGDTVSHGSVDALIDPAADHRYGAIGHEIEAMVMVNQSAREERIYRGLVLVQAPAMNIEIDNRSMTVGDDGLLYSDPEHARREGAEPLESLEQTIMEIVTLPMRVAPAEADLWTPEVTRDVFRWVWERLMTAPVTNDQDAGIRLAEVFPANLFVHITPGFEDLLVARPFPSDRPLYVQTTVGVPITGLESFIAWMARDGRIPHRDWELRVNAARLFADEVARRFVFELVGPGTWSVELFDFDESVTALRGYLALVFLHAVAVVSSDIERDEEHLIKNELPLAVRHPLSAIRQALPMNVQNFLRRHHGSLLPFFVTRYRDLHPETLSALPENILEAGVPHTAAQYLISALNPDDVSAVIDQFSALGVNKTEGFYHALDHAGLAPLPLVLIEIRAFRDIDVDVDQFVAHSVEIVDHISRLYDEAWQRAMGAPPPLWQVVQAPVVGGVVAAIDSIDSLARRADPRWFVLADFIRQVRVDVGRVASNWPGAGLNLRGSLARLDNQVGLFAQEAHANIPAGEIQQARAHVRQLINHLFPPVPGLAAGPLPVTGGDDLAASGPPRSGLSWWDPAGDRQLEFESRYGAVLARVNDGGRAVEPEPGSGSFANCVLTALALHMSLAEEGSFRAPPLKEGWPGLPLVVLEAYADASAGPGVSRSLVAVSGFEAISAGMLSAGVGAHGFVVVSDRGAGPGHVLNVVRDADGVVFLDSQAGGVASLPSSAVVHFIAVGPVEVPMPAVALGPVVSRGALSEVLDRVADRVPAGPQEDPASCVVLLNDAFKSLFPGRVVAGDRVGAGGDRVRAGAVAAAAGAVDDLVLDGRQSSGLIGGARSVPVRSWDEVERRLRAVPSPGAATALVLALRSDTVGHALGAYRFPDGRIAWFDLQRGSGARVLDGQPTLSAARASVVVVDAAGREVPGGDTVSHGSVDALIDPAADHRYGATGAEAESTAIVNISREQELFLMIEVLADSENLRAHLDHDGGFAIIELVTKPYNVLDGETTHRDRTAVIADLRRELERLRNVTPGTRMGDFYSEELGFTLEEDVDAFNIVARHRRGMAFLQYTTGVPLAGIPDLMRFAERNVRRDDDEVPPSIPLSRAAIAFGDMAASRYVRHGNSAVIGRDLEAMSLRGFLTVAFAHVLAPLVAQAHRLGLTKNALLVASRVSLSAMRESLPENVRTWLSDHAQELRDLVRAHAGINDEWVASIVSQLPDVLDFRQSMPERGQSYLLGQFLDNALLPEGPGNQPLDQYQTLGIRTHMTVLETPAGGLPVAPHELRDFGRGRIDTDEIVHNLDLIDATAIAIDRRFRSLARHPEPSGRDHTGRVDFEPGRRRLEEHHQKRIDALAYQVVRDAAHDLAAGRSRQTLVHVEGGGNRARSGAGADRARHVATALNEAIAQQLPRWNLRPADVVVRAVDRGTAPSQQPDALDDRAHEAQNRSVRIWSERLSSVSETPWGAGQVMPVVQAGPSERAGSRFGSMRSTLRRRLALSTGSWRVGASFFGDGSSGIESVLPPSAYAADEVAAAFPYLARVNEEAGEQAATNCTIATLTYALAVAEKTTLLASGSDRLPGADMLAFQRQRRGLPDDRTEAWLTPSLEALIEVMGEAEPGTRALTGIRSGTADAHHFIVVERGPGGVAFLDPQSGGLARLPIDTVAMVVLPLDGEVRMPAGARRLTADEIAPPPEPAAGRLDVPMPEVAGGIPVAVDLGPVASREALSEVLESVADRVRVRPGNDPASCVVLLNDAFKSLFPGRVGAGDREQSGGGRVRAGAVAAAAGAVDDLVLDGRQTSGLVGGARLVPVRSWAEVAQRLVDAGPSSTALALVQRGSGVGHALGAHRLPGGEVVWFDLQRGPGARVLAGEPELSPARASVVVVDATGREVRGGETVSHSSVDALIDPATDHRYGAVGVEVETRALLGVTPAQAIASRITKLASSPTLNVTWDKNRGEIIVELVTAPYRLLDGETGFAERSDVVTALERQLDRLVTVEPGTSFADWFTPEEGFRVNPAVEALTIERAHQPGGAYVHYTTGVPIAGLFDLMRFAEQNDTLRTVNARSRIDLSSRARAFAIQAAEGFVGHQDQQAFENDFEAASVRGFMATVFAHVGAHLVHWAHQGKLVKNQLLVASRVSLAAMRSELPAVVQEWLADNAEAIRGLLQAHAAHIDDKVARLLLESPTVFQNGWQTDSGETQTLMDYLNTALLPGGPQNPPVSQYDAMGIRTDMTHLDTPVGGLPLAPQELRSFGWNRIDTHTLRAYRHQIETETIRIDTMFRAMPRHPDPAGRDRTGTVRFDARERALHDRHRPRIDALGYQIVRDAVRSHAGGALQQSMVVVEGGGNVEGSGAGAARARAVATALSAVIRDELQRWNADPDLVVVRAFDRGTAPSRHPSLNVEPDVQAQNRSVRVWTEGLPTRSETPWDGGRFPVVSTRTGLAASSSVFRELGSAAGRALHALSGSERLGGRRPAGPSQPAASPVPESVQHLSRLVRDAADLVGPAVWDPDTFRAALLDLRFQTGVRLFPDDEETGAVEFLRERERERRDGRSNGPRSWMELRRMIEVAQENGLVITSSGAGSAVYTIADGEIWRVDAGPDADFVPRRWTEPSPLLAEIEQPPLEAISFNHCAHWRG
ncbi:toxin glutamine deamidase domain-containing protein [Actinoplanes sp. NPDC049596]|uniref:toxin glutamine deamidase domain-containing protein n=1 Tax=unclassified Actinoplanes TaxID=2626549 RepID=UPI00342A12C1